MKQSEAAEAILTLGAVLIALAMPVIVAIWIIMKRRGRRR